MPNWARDLALEIVPPKVGQQSPRRLKLRICEVCNSKMGSLYESTTAEFLKPMMRNLTATSLTPRHQGLIGRWIIKTTLLFVIKDSILNGHNHDAESHALFDMNETGLPPDGFSVRIARYLADDDPSERPGEGLRGPLQGARRFGMFSYHSLAHLAMEVVAGDPHSALDFIERTKDDDRFIRVWPPSVKLVDFAPRTILTKADLDAMRSQLITLNGMTRFSRHVWGPDAGMIDEGKLGKPFV